MLVALVLTFRAKRTILKAVKRIFNKHKNNFMNETIIVGGVGLSVVILVIIQALKYISLPGKFIPILAIILGLAGSLSYQAFGDSAITVVQAVVAGIMAGASASGLYSYGKEYIPSVLKSSTDINTTS